MKFHWELTELFEFLYLDAKSTFAKFRSGAATIRLETAVIHICTSITQFFRLQNSFSFGHCITPGPSTHLCAVYYSSRHVIFSLTICNTAAILKYSCYERTSRHYTLRDRATRETRQRPSSPWSKQLGLSSSNKLYPTSRGCSGLLKACGPPASSWIQWRKYASGKTCPL